MDRRMDRGGGPGSARSTLAGVRCTPRRALVTFGCSRAGSPLRPIERAPVAEEWGTAFALGDAKAEVASSPQAAYAQWRTAPVLRTESGTVLVTHRSDITAVL